MTSTYIYGDLLADIIYFPIKYIDYMKQKTTIVQSMFNAILRDFQGNCILCEVSYIFHLKVFLGPSIWSRPKIECENILLI